MHLAKEPNPIKPMDILGSIVCPGCKAQEMKGGMRAVCLRA
jgi:hypothetical protein